MLNYVELVNESSRNFSILFDGVIYIGGAQTLVSER